MSGHEGSSTARGLRRQAARAVTVLVAMAAAAAVWTLAVSGLGVALRVPASGGAPMVIGLPQVVLTVAVVALPAWALLTFLERHTDRARGVWTATAAAVLLLSYAAPLSARAGAAATVVLLLLHTVVGLVLLAGFRRTVATPSAAPALATPQASVVGSRSTS